jgi:hypothetical protein
MTLPSYRADPLKYYAALREIPPEQLTREWREISLDGYYRLLESVPPIRLKDNAFLCGECMTHTLHGAIYEAVVQVDGRYFSRPAYLQTFDPEAFTREVRELFNL